MTVCEYTIVVVRYQTITISIERVRGYNVYDPHSFYLQRAEEKQRKSNKKRNKWKIYNYRLAPLTHSSLVKAEAAPPVGNTASATSSIHLHQPYPFVISDYAETGASPTVWGSAGYVASLIGGLRFSRWIWAPLSVLDNARWRNVNKTLAAHDELQATKSLPQVAADNRIECGLCGEVSCYCCWC